MAVQNFVLELMEGLLGNKELGLTEEDIRFYDRGTTAGQDEALDSHIKWQNAMYYNSHSNVVRSSILILRLAVNDGAEYLTFPVGDIYRNYRQSSMERVLTDMEVILKKARGAAVKTLELMGQFGDLEAIRDRLILRPLNYDDNSTVLENGVYRRIGDMALALYVDMGTESGQMLSTMVTRKLFQIWNTDETEILDWALGNTMRLQPPVLYQVTGERISPLDEGAVMDLNGLLPPTLTTELEVNGAIAAFFPAVQRRLHDMIGGDFYLVFTSIYDAHIHPVDGWVKVKDMRRCLAEMNRKINKQREILARKIYRYDGAAGALVEVP